MSPVSTVQAGRCPMFRGLMNKDRAFVAFSWAKSFYYSHWCGPWTEGEFWPMVRPKLDGFLADPGVKVLLSVNPGDPDQIFGFACYMPDDIPKLLYLYVKHTFRDHKCSELKPRIGIRLLRELGMADGARFEYVFRTRAWDKFSQKWRLNAKFRPEIAKGRYDRSPDDQH